MHPAASVIAFTTLSGAGFGMLIFLGLGVLAPTGWVAFVFYLIAYALSVGGLISSTLHLGHPERALKAFTQWRSSWLSREGWTAVATLFVMALFAAGQVFFGAHWSILGWIGAVLAALTVLCTAMIYAQLRTVPRWNQTLTPALFLTLSVAGGALLTGQVQLAVVLTLLASVIQIAWWITGDTALRRSGSDLATATGLGDIGVPRAFEPPHTGPNYLLNEMVFVIGRKHASRLRIIAFLLAYTFPILLLVLGGGHLVAGLAVLSHLAGVAASRWLFFAEAEHVVGLYYGMR